MANTPTGSSRKAGNVGKQVVQFTLADAARIAGVVAQVEGARRNRRGSTMPRAIGGGGISTATFSGTWMKGASKTIHLNGSTATTAACTNIVADVLYSASERRCIVSGGGDGMILINVECA
jgi:hypothetical protein